MNGLHIIRYPSGRFGYVGRVPEILAMEGCAEDAANAKVVGMTIAQGIAKRAGRTLKNRSFETYDAAVAFAQSHGFKIK